MRILISVTAVLLAASCHPPGREADAGVLKTDAGPETDAGVENDAGVAIDSGLTTCPTVGMGGIIAPAGCFVFTPAEAGASDAGVNATIPHYALEPAGTPQGALLVYFNSSQASPARQIANPTQNFYNSAANAGLHVLALSYRSSQVIGVICNNDGPCFALARKAVLQGQPEPDGPADLSDMREDEGAIQRLEAALQYLTARRPGSGWEQFLTNGAKASDRVVWSKVTAAGHSQGGGHAAFLGKLFAIHGVIQLSSTCDAVGSTPAPWTSDDIWATSPAAHFVGFGSTGDLICPRHVAIWQAMGLEASRQFDDAQLCGGIAHNGSITCALNAPKWATFF